MVSVVLAAAKGSPGATTAALALASVWPRQVLLVDGDPAGGDVSLRLPGEHGPLDPDRGLLSLGAAVRRGLDDATLLAHSQRLLGGLDVIGGLRTTEQAAGLDPLWAPLGTALRRLPDRDAVVDAGRLGPSSPVLPVLGSAHLVVLVTRPDVSSLFHTRERLDALTRTVRAGSVDVVRFAVIIVADPDDRRATEAARGVFERQENRPDAVWTLPLDRRGAQVFGGDLVSRPERTSLVRAATALAPSVLQLAESAARTADPGAAQARDQALGAYAMGGGVA